MKHKVIGGVLAAAAVGAMTTTSFAGVASAAPIASVHQQQGPDSNDWRGGGAPAGIDRHCDRNGNWHNSNNDRGGHRDARCRAW
ncbi:hypothetical protein [Nocardia alni]|uniref:hypothetical protein n=1 Tax=Nocardia alni TaxID=2815723 RepID=UPI001C25140B|nr:hypothetical protein [Nocardia alni]